MAVDIGISDIRYLGTPRIGQPLTVEVDISHSRTFGDFSSRNFAVEFYVNDGQFRLPDQVFQTSSFIATPGRTITFTFTPTLAVDLRLSAVVNYLDNRGNDSNAGNDSRTESYDNVVKGSAGDPRFQDANATGSNTLFGSTGNDRLIGNGDTNLFLGREGGDFMNG